MATDIHWLRELISHCCELLLAKNDNFTLYLTGSGQEWHYHAATDI